MKNFTFDNFKIRLLQVVIIFTLALFSMSNLSAQDKKYIEIKSKMWFVSELDHSSIMMDEEGNQFDYYDNFIVVYKKGKKIKIPYQSNYIFWDEYDENMNVTKKVCTVIIEVTEINDVDSKKRISYKLFKVFDDQKLIYDATKKNPFIE